MKQQTVTNRNDLTAVEWLEEELKGNLAHIIFNNDHVMMERLFLQAKQMEEEQKCHVPDIGKKLTAVEWLEREFKKIPFIDPVKAFHQAKEMEEEQRFEAWNGGINSTEEGGISYDQYYNIKK